MYKRAGARQHTRVCVSVHGYVCIYICVRVCVYVCVRVIKRTSDKWPSRASMSAMCVRLRGLRHDRWQVAPVKIPFRRVCPTYPVIARGRAIHPTPLLPPCYRTSPPRKNIFIPIAYLSCAQRRPTSFVATTNATCHHSSVLFFSLTLSLSHYSFLLTLSFTHSRLVLIILSFYQLHILPPSTFCFEKPQKTKKLLYIFF